MKKILTIFIVFVLIAICVRGFLSYERKKDVKTNDEIISQNDLFDVSGIDIAIIYDFSLQSQKGLLRNNTSYLPLSWIHDYINDKFYWDSSIRSIIYTLPEDIECFRLSDEEGSAAPRFFMANDEIYLSLDFIKSRSCIYCDEFKNETANRIFINDSKDSFETAQIQKSTMLRTGESSLQRGIIPLNEGDTVRIITEKDTGWTRVYTESGFLGYTEAGHLGNRKSAEPVISYSNPVYSHILMDEEILLAWNQVDNMTSNHNLPDLIRRSSGINVVSPTWFSIIDNSGTLKAIPSHDYIDYAHGNDIQVWALIDNFDPGINSTTVLSDWNARQNIIQQLIKYSTEYGFDGINVDFEHLEEKCGPHFVEFIRELSVSCRNNGLVLSVDNPNMQTFNTFYGRDAQAECADYVINMGYDEHYSGGDAGSVASLPFVEEGILNSLSQVPANQLINGLPFYTRIWIVENGNIDSQAVGLETAADFVKENKINLTWDEELGQNTGNTDKYYIWMEDSDSLRVKINLGRNNGLAGFAGWKLGMESPEIWDLFKK